MKILNCIVKILHKLFNISLGKAIKNIVIELLIAYIPSERLYVPLQLLP